MATRYNILSVVLEQPMTSEELEPLVTALRTMRGVAAVRESTPDGIDTWLEACRLRTHAKLEMHRAVESVFLRLDNGNDQQ